MNSNMMWSLPGAPSLEARRQPETDVERVEVLFAAALAVLAVSQHAAAGPALLVEPSTGLVLYAEDADLPWRPASLTKLMTAYITFEAIRDGRLSPEDTVICTQHAQSSRPAGLACPSAASSRWTWP